MRALNISGTAATERKDGHAREGEGVEGGGGCEHLRLGLARDRVVLRLEADLPLLRALHLVGLHPVAEAVRRVSECVRWSAGPVSPSLHCGPRSNAPPRRDHSRTQMRRALARRGASWRGTRSHLRMRARMGFTWGRRWEGPAAYGGRQIVRDALQVLACGIQLHARTHALHAMHACTPKRAMHVFVTTCAANSRDCTGAGEGGGGGSTWRSHSCFSAACFSVMRSWCSSSAAGRMLRAAPA